jgi:hypothetical protein
MPAMGSSAVRTALYEELLAPGAGDDATSPPGEPDVVIPMVVRLGGRELRMFSTTTTFSTPVDVTLAEIVIESYYPADEATAAYFTKPDGGAASKHRSR